MWLTVLLASVCGGLGAVARWVFDTAVTKTLRPSGPLGIFIVNVVASALLGALLGYVAAADLTRFVGDTTGTQTASLLLGAGFLGGFSTLSTVAVDSVMLVKNRQRRHWVWFFANTFGMFAVAVTALFLAQLATTTLIHP